jgi:hypothetical protein
MKHLRHLATALLLVAASVFAAATIIDRVDAANAVNGTEYVPVGNSYRTFDQYRGASTFTVPIGGPVTDYACVVAAHVNVTYAQTVGPSFLAAWGAGAWNGTSLVNINGAGQAASNAANISVFMTNVTQPTIQVMIPMGGRVAVDVMGWYKRC